MSNLEQNPANEVEVRVSDANRVPMTLPMQRLEAPEIPGHHCHWMRGDAARIQQAMRAGYEFVTGDEILVNNLDVGGDASKTGNTDMGTRVSVLASVGGDGEIGNDGQPGRLYLMKIKQEWFEKDQGILAQRNADIAESIRGGTLDAGKNGETQGDIAARYARLEGRTQAPQKPLPRNMFTPKTSPRSP